MVSWVRALTLPAAVSPMPAWTRSATVSRKAENRRTLFEVVDEQLGADLMQAPRTVPLSLARPAQRTAGGGACRGSVLRPGTLAQGPGQAEPPEPGEGAERGFPKRSRETP